MEPVFLQYDPEGLASDNERRCVSQRDSASRWYKLLFDFNPIEAACMH